MLRLLAREMYIKRLICSILVAILLPLPLLYQFFPPLLPAHIFLDPALPVGKPRFSSVQIQNRCSFAFWTENRKIFRFCVRPHPCSCFISAYWAQYPFFIYHISIRSHFCSVYGSCSKKYFLFCFKTAGFCRFVDHQK